MVSKDINMRIKARAVGSVARGLLQRQGPRNTDLLYSGTRALPADFWEKHGKIWSPGSRAHDVLPHAWTPVSDLIVNAFVYLEGDTPFHAH